MMLGFTQANKEGKMYLIERAVEQLNGNNTAEAIKSFDGVSCSLPEFDKIYYGKAVAQARIGNLKEAVESLMLLLSKYPNHSKGKRLLAELTEGSKEKVQEMLQQAVKLLETGQKVEALRLAEKAASFGIFVPGMHYLRAVCSGSVGRYEEALEAAQEELENNPTHAEAQKQVESLTKSLTRPKRAAIPTDQRPWNTTLPYELMMSIQNGLHNYSYKGVPLQKNPFDFAIYPLLLWKLKPRTIIEIGSKNGGSALWFGDLLNNYGIDGHIYSVDIVKVTKYSHPRVTFMEGDGQALYEIFSEDFLKGLPRPLLVIEDADHSFTTSKLVLDFFHPYLDKDEYIVVEDGIISDIIQDANYNSGPHQALKAFLAEHRGEYDIDGEYCDFFGYNLTWATNGYLKKRVKATETEATVSSLNQKSRSNPSGEADLEFQQILEVIRPYTMLSEARLYSLFSLAKQVCLENIPGNFVECGVAAGGSTALMAAVIKRYTKQPRWLYAFDSFEGIAKPAVPGTGTCAASETSVNEICSKLGVTDVVQTVKGYFENTLPIMQNQVGMIALLHMDGDWYESTKAILHNLYDRVSNNGFIQVDDYGHWEGCRQAVHEFESDCQLQFNLNQIDDTGVWFQCRDKFPINPIFERSLLQEFQEDDPVAYGIQSQMSCNERFQLYYVLRQLLPETSSPLRFIEIGSFAGSSLFLNYRALKRSHPQIQGFAIDPGLHPQLQLVLQQLPEEVTHLRMFSHHAVDQLKQLFDRDQNLPPFIFVDGDHTYEGVRQDIINYFPLLAPGGIMAFHDYLPPLNEKNQNAILFHHGGKEPGIRQACQELMEHEYGCELIEIPLLYPTDPTQTQACLPIIPEVFSTVKVYRKPNH